MLSESLADLSQNWGDKLTKLIIVDNGKQNIPAIIPENLKPQTIVYEEDTNLGVAASWNKGIHAGYFKEPVVDHMLILNDDIVLGKTPDIIYNLIEKTPGYSILGGNYY